MHNFNPLNKRDKFLLKELKEPSEDTELLSDVKKSIDPVGKLRGKPGFKAEILISVRLYFANAGGVIVPGALPAQLQIPIPLYLFGLTDFYGGYARSQVVLPIANPNWILWINEIITNPGAFPRPAFIPFLQTGDMVMYYQINILGVFWWALLVVRCNNVAYGTFLHSFSDDLIVLNLIRYSVPLLNLNQLDNTLNFATQSLFGKYVSDTIDPKMYITNQTFNQNIADIPVSLPIDKTLIMGTYINFDCPEVTFLLTIQKIKSLRFK